MNRRIYCMLSKRLDEAALTEVPDRRDARGKRWRLAALLRAVVGGMLGGTKSLAEVEDLSTRLSRPVRRLLGVRRRVPDTTLRDALATVEPGDVREPLHAITRAAHRRKALEPEGLPFGVVSFDGKLRREERYLVSSLPRCRLTAEHWLLVLRRHWGVETAHQVLDVAFAEDDHPWIEAHPRAALVVAILRRVAYTRLTLFRTVTQRSDERRSVPWKSLMRDVLFALVTSTDEQLAGHLARRPT